MNSKHRRTLEAIFAKPTRSDLAWSDVERLFVALGGHVYEGAGSRVRVLVNHLPAVFHRPHPKPIASKALVDSVRAFLIDAGVKP